MGEQRDAYVARLKLKMDEWNVEIDVLQSKTREAHDEALVSYNKQIEELKSKRDDLKFKMAELHKAGDSAWEDLKEGVGTAWKALGDSIEGAKARFK